jgi:hypothetical protein
MGAGYSLEEKTIKATPGQIVQLPQTNKHDVQYSIANSVTDQVFVLPYLEKKGQFEFSITAEASNVIVRLGPSWVDHLPHFFDSSKELTLTQGDSILLEGRVIQQHAFFQNNIMYITAAYIISPTTGAEDAPEST